MLKTNILHITNTSPHKDLRILNIAESVSIIDDSFHQYIIGLNRDKFLNNHRKKN